MDLSHARTFKPGQTELRRKKNQTKGLHSVKFGMILNQNMVMNELISFTSTNTLTFSLIYLTDGCSLPQQGEDLGRDEQKTINTEVYRAGFSETGLYICGI